MHGNATSARLLLATACCWESTVPLAVALCNAGFEVSVVAPRGHPLHALPGLAGRWRYRPLMPVTSLRRAIEAAAPSLVMPCDEPTMVLLQKLRNDRHLTTRARDTLERSLGAAEASPALASRAGLRHIAERTGVRIPQSAPIRSARQLSAWIRQYGTPAYVKIDRSTGGKGVIRVESAAEALWAYFRLRLLFGVPRLIWLWLRWGDLSSVSLLMAESPAGITIQKAVEGIPANCAVTAWRGQLRACIAVEALETRTPTGVATVVRVRDDALMEDAARKVAASLGLSGLYGLDFILSRETDEPWLVEVNGRPTQTAYFRLGPGADLAGALYAAVTGTREEPVGVFKAGEIITLFDEPRGGRPRIQNSLVPALEEQDGTLPLKLEPAAKSAMLSP
jgi:hypothetical protein